MKELKNLWKHLAKKLKKKLNFQDEKITSLRHDLIKKSLDELKEAMDNKDIKEVADA